MAPQSILATALSRIARQHPVGRAMPVPGIPVSQEHGKSQATYRYPVFIHVLVNSLAIGLLVVNGAEFLLTWARVILGWVGPLPNTLYPRPLSFQEGLETLLISHIGLLAALILARGIIFFSPQIYIESDGLRMRTLLGYRFIRYSDLKSIRSTEIQENGRFVVWVSCSPGLPMQNLLGSLLFKRLFRQGFLILSDLSGFDAVISTIVQQLQVTYQDAYTAHVFEEQPTWLVSMLDVPGETITEIARSDVIPLDRKTAAYQMLLAIGALVLPLAIGAVIHWQFPWSALVLAVLALGEWPLASLFIVTVPLGEYRKISFEDALRVYPLTQLPRWLVGLILTFLVVAGLPLVLYVPFVGLALILDCYWVMRLAEEWFAVRFPEAALATVATGTYQFVLFLLLFAFLPR